MALTIEKLRVIAGPISLSEEDQISMAHYAIRYCLQRRSYAVEQGRRWALMYGKKYPFLRIQLCKEIGEALKDHVANMMIDDAARWRRVLQELSDLSLREHNTRPWETVDTCPENTYVETRREGEEGTMVCAYRIVRQPDCVPDDMEWVEKYEGITTVTHHSFLPPTHWRPF